jgi:hypothetical protein
MSTGTAVRCVVVIGYRRRTVLPVNPVNVCIVRLFGPQTHEDYEDDRWAESNFLSLELNTGSSSYKRKSIN